MFFFPASVKINLFIIDGIDFYDDHHHHHLPPVVFILIFSDLCVHFNEQQVPISTYTCYCYWFFLKGFKENCVFAKRKM